MKKRIINKISSIDGGDIQDLIILVGIFIFSSILIIGLFPEGRLGPVGLEELFLYSIVTLPVVAAIYFIIISFRRNLYYKTEKVKSSLKNRIAMAFIFIAIIPVLTVVIASNYLLTHSLSNLYFDETIHSLDESVKAADEKIVSIGSQLTGETESAEIMIERGFINYASLNSRDIYRNMLQKKGIEVTFFYLADNYSAELIPLDVEPKGHDTIHLFYSSLSDLTKSRIDRITVDSIEIICTSHLSGRYLAVLYKEIPEILLQRRQLFENSIIHNSGLENMKKYFKDGTSVFLFWLTITVIALAVLLSIFISKKITSPVFDLVEASKRLANGDFNIRIKRKSEDELGLLAETFNRMVVELDHSRRNVYQKQRLEAWREVARRVVHEIKNPLTPIRLSADRMRKRYVEKHPDIDNIIIGGTETISEEVETLMNLLEEFTRFARLPEMQKEPEDLNYLIDNTLNLFYVHESVEFIFKPDKSMPQISFDKMLLRQAVLNLIQNAVDAIGYEGRVTIKTKYVNDAFSSFARIIISDNGPGIKEDELENIFEPGFSTKTSGSGLGLAIVEKIIIEHSGSIVCNSVFGEGTEFTIELPVE